MDKNIKPGDKTTLTKSPAKKALVTLAIGEPKEMSWTFPRFRDYCARHGLDFVPITQRVLRLNPRWTRPRLGIHLEKFQLAGLLGCYERVLYLDADVLVMPDAPDVFGQVPHEAIGVVYEDLGPDAWKREEEWRKAEKKLGRLPESHRYFNAGVLVLSAAHQALFDLRHGLPGGRWPDQTFLNYHSRALAYPIHELPAQFNFLPVFAGWEEAERRRENHFVHYAGRRAKEFLALDAKTPDRRR